MIRDVSLIASAFISFNFYHFSRPRDAIRRRMPVGKGWRREGRVKTLESQMGECWGEEKKKKKREEKENKREEKIHEFVRRVGLFHFGWKIYRHRVFGSILWKILKSIEKLLLFGWFLFFFFLIIKRYKFSKFRIVWRNNAFWFMCITLCISRFKIKSGQRSDS